MSFLVMHAKGPLPRSGVPGGCAEPAFSLRVRESRLIYKKTLTFLSPSPPQFSSAQAISTDQRVLLSIRAALSKKTQPKPHDLLKSEDAP